MRFVSEVISWAAAIIRKQVDAREENVFLTRHLELDCFKLNRGSGIR